MSEIFKPENKIETITPSAKELDLEIEDQKFDFKEYDIGEAPKEGVVSPGNMETGNLEEIEKLFQKEPSRINNFIECANVVPYSFLHREAKKNYGDYTTAKGQDEFKDSDLVLTKDPFSPPDWAKELWDFARMKTRKTFKTDSVMACLRALKIKNGKPVFTIGAGPYSDSFYSNGSEGVKIGLNSKERESLLQKVSAGELGKLEETAARLEGKYGKGRTIRDIIISRYGHIPEFGEQVYNNNVGVAGMVLTRDNEFVFVKRGSNVSINQGVNCTASGAAEFDEATLSQYGIQHFLGNEMSRETNEELGLKAGTLIVGSMKKRIQLELGLDDSEYDLIPVGFIRELPRGGKPECMFLIQYKGATQDLVKSVIENPHSEKKEIEGSVFSLAQSETDKLLSTKGAGSFIQHKGIVNLMLCNEYLKNAQK
jgi:hypothetical protein